MSVHDLADDNMMADLALIAAAADPEMLDAVQQQDADTTTTDADAVAVKVEAGDVGAPFEPAALAVLRNLKAQSVAGWVRLRERLKRAGVGVTELEKQLRHGDGAPPDNDESVADRLIALARSQCEFMHDAQREPYAVFEAGGARQVHGVLSQGFSDFLSHAYYIQHWSCPRIPGHGLCAM